MPTEHMICVTNSKIYNNNKQKVARILRANLNILTEWKAKERKTIKYFSHCRVNTWHLVCYLFPESICYLLLSRRERVVVRVKEHDRFFSCLVFGNGFPLLSVTGSFPWRMIVV